MTNKLVVIINSLKEPKIKKILLYEMKFLVPNYSCLQNPWVGGCCPQIPFFSFLCPQLNLLNPPPQTKFLGMPLLYIIPLLPKWVKLVYLFSHTGTVGKEQNAYSWVTVTSWQYYTKLTFNAFYKKEIHTGKSQFMFTEINLNTILIIHVM
jgi:hypothetical protein